MPTGPRPTQRDWLPKFRTFWVWELGNPHARSIIQVDRVEWNGEEWWVYCRKLAIDAPISEGIPDESGVYANELDRFWEACTPIGGRLEDLREGGAVTPPMTTPNRRNPRS